mgnify:CR=1 FL=1
MYSNPGEESGLTAGTDFKVGYSPERINPGDKKHRLENITKIVSGMDRESLEVIADVYDIVIAAGTYRVSSIKAAEPLKWRRTAKGISTSRS